MPPISLPFSYTAFSLLKTWSEICSFGNTNVANPILTLSCGTNIKNTPHGICPWYFSTRDMCVARTNEHHVSNWEEWLLFVQAFALGPNGHYFDGKVVFSNDGGFSWEVLYFYDGWLRANPPRKCANIALAVTDVTECRLRQNGQKKRKREDYETFLDTQIDGENCDNGCGLGRTQKKRKMLHVNDNVPSGEKDTQRTFFYHEKKAPSRTLDWCILRKDMTPKGTSDVIMFFGASQTYWRPQGEKFYVAYFP